MTNLTSPIFNDEEAARIHFEAIRWPDGRVCPHCGTVGNSTLMQGKTTRPGLYKCKDCRKPFTATMGTVYERSHIPLHKWLLATHLIVASKKGISSHQLFRMLGFGSYRTAWFMSHRIREAMTPTTEPFPPMGNDGGMVEVDETYIGGKVSGKGPGWIENKTIVLGMYERGGDVRTVVVSDRKSGTLLPIIKSSVARNTEVHTDELTAYGSLPMHGYWHKSVNHRAGEYVSRTGTTVNALEGYWSALKRAINGTHIHVSGRHLPKYLAEFEFRHNLRKTPHLMLSALMTGFAR